MRLVPGVVASGMGVRSPRMAASFALRRWLPTSSCLTRSNKE